MIYNPIKKLDIGNLYYSAYSQVNKAVHAGKDIFNTQINRLSDLVNYTFNYQDSQLIYATVSNAPSRYSKSRADVSPNDMGTIDTLYMSRRNGSRRRGKTAGTGGYKSSSYRIFKAQERSHEGESIDQTGSDRSSGNPMGQDRLSALIFEVADAPKTETKAQRRANKRLAWLNDNEH